MTTGYDEEGIGVLLRALPRPPEAWIRAAQELPAARVALGGLVERALADAELRRTVLADLEAALRQEGVEPDRRSIAALRARLTDL
jgi:hypothetical protein